ncbi:Bacterial transferase hexapeptide (six repeats), putative [Trypanosoma equiperdum]|uniref:Uncharacterized protein n=3 Tax=Trypanozoon TaxID=39700 RepID=C9ZPP8_TRYB9|nr:hypothetical protein, conserved [Trypanosoma brucei gambiense DAL972]RHW72334.1 Bacterial transferase hexapeptide (six repeats) [Trypanosoma brucei equiperdum]CBH11376.1 hypothetical protein, conserved [Trypanosoma brucei gambiense DAL972]SCU68219.1 Bacterial transferase hexapeptide (six repeats), putative [Trypanosoma equiperdum]|eukprot:XP_011773663.1 hypothetical protein, conserved [Trypanosoma brucei gambiense DAL972]
MPATIVSGVAPYFAFMLKDIGARLAIMSHYLKTKRHMYPVTRHQNVRAYRGMLPWTQDSAFIAPTAFVSGNVSLGHDTCIFYHTVIRNYNIRDETAIGDHTVVMDRVSFLGQVRVGGGVYIGPGSTLDCCTVGDNAYIGAGASIALGAVVENNAIIAAGSHVPKDTHVYAYELWAGNPAQKVEEVSPDQVAEVASIVHDQIAVGKAHAHAIHEHMHHTAELDAEWLHHALEAMEKQQQQMALKLPVDIPLEAKRFLTPRVHMRRPEMHMRMSYPVNRIAPWMPKVADQTANA